MPQPQAPCPFSALEAPASLTWPFPQGPVPLPGQMALARLALSVTLISADTLLFEYKYARICPLTPSSSPSRFFFSLGFLIFFLDLIL